LGKLCSQELFSLFEEAVNTNIVDTVHTKSKPLDSSSNFT